MRIYGNRAIETLPGLQARPTPGRVREAVFNIWQGTIADCRWLDLCAGNGTMGAEALCRGAREAIAIEQSGRSCAIIQRNWTKVAQPQQHFRVVRGDARRKLKDLAGEPFDRVYFDPPYASDLYEPILALLAELGLVAIGGEVAVESDRDRVPLAPPTGWECPRRKLYGQTAVTFYTIFQH